MHDMIAAAGFRVEPSVGRDAWLSGQVDHAVHDTDRRQLRIYAVDPSLSRLEGAIATPSLPYEPLAPGPRGLTLEVDPVLPDGRRYQVADLETSAALRHGGYEPDGAASAFHCQMVYAVAQLSRMAFCRALGRTIGWAFGPQPGAASAPLTLKPFGMAERNAYYSRDERAVIFGFFRSDGSLGAFPADKYVFTSLSSDVIVHEMSHALLDAVRPDYFIPTNPDLAAFHESFADLMALFQRFNYPELVRAALRRTRGDVRGRLFTALAPEFGRSTGLGLALRTFAPGAAGDPLAEETAPPLQYRPDDGESPHERGRVLTEAVLEAYSTIVERRIAPLLRLASGGTGVVPEGELPPELLDLITTKAIRVAGHFRNMCIRALDYCPATDLEFGDFLRALLTADAILVPDDPHGYREALISAFRRRSLYPRHVRTLSESSLRWASPCLDLRPIDGLALSQLNFPAEPASPPSRKESVRQAEVLGRRIVSDPALARELGLVLDGASAAPDAEFGLPRVVDIRPTRRVGPDGQVGYDLTAQVLQDRQVRTPGGDLYPFTGGASLLLDRQGRPCMVVRNRVDHPERLERQLAYVTGPGKGFWRAVQGRLAPSDDRWDRLCPGGRRSSPPEN